MVKFFSTKNLLTTFKLSIVNLSASAIFLGVFFLVSALPEGLLKNSLYIIGLVSGLFIGGWSANSIWGWS